MKSFAISISPGTISTRHRSSKSPRRPLTLASMPWMEALEDAHEIITSKGGLLQVQAAHAPVGLELQTSEGEGQSGIDAKASIKAASLVGPWWMVKRD